MANGHHQFSSFLGMLSAAAVPAAYGGAPSGFMDSGAGFGGLSGSSLGAMMDHPGCSKVIGKAVLLVEIINYVQSLQRQVEFLSMKLSAVNPALEFNIERILSKDFFQSQGPASSAFGFLPDIGHQFLHPPKHSQAAFHSMVNSTDAFGRVTNGPQGSSSTFNEPTHQMPSNFDGEFHNVTGTPFTLFNDQESNGLGVPSSGGVRFRSGSTIAAAGTRRRRRQPRTLSVSGSTLPSPLTGNTRRRCRSCRTEQRRCRSCRTEQRRCRSCRS